MLTKNQILIQCYGNSFVTLVLVNIVYQWQFTCIIFKTPDLFLAISPDGLLCQCREQRAWQGCRSTLGVNQGIGQPYHLSLHTKIHVFILPF